ncbi:hypothetical protein CGRA01v4_02448 [Colletotrichum graminicola]|nr:hypothetical protein CGRA01v4_02448 [Colletotrichum graminicola]
MTASEWLALVCARAAECLLSYRSSAYPPVKFVTQERRGKCSGLAFFLLDQNQKNFSATGQTLCRVTATLSDSRPFSAFSSAINLPVQSSSSNWEPVSPASASLVLAESKWDVHSVAPSSPSSR